MRITEVSPADKARMVDLLSQEYDNVCDRLTTPAAWERLRQYFLGKLRLFGATPTASDDWPTSIVEWARAGHPAADRALRDYGREMGEQSRFDHMLVCVRSYYLDTSGKPFVPFPRGRHVVANMMRNIWTEVVLDNVAAATGLSATRSNTTSVPSVAYFLFLMAKKKRIKLKEQEINRIYWDRKKLSGLIEASMPKINFHPS
jgi:hypothetical protein